MSIQIVDILEFKKQKTSEKCNECYKEVKLEAYRTALSEIIDILLKMPISS